MALGASTVLTVGLVQTANLHVCTARLHSNGVVATDTFPASTVQCRAPDSTSEIFVLDTETVHMVTTLQQVYAAAKRAGTQKTVAKGAQRRCVRVPHSFWNTACVTPTRANAFAKTTM